MTRTPVALARYCPEPGDDLALRAVISCTKRHGDERQAQRALLQATEDLTLCFTAACERLRQDGTTCWGAQYSVIRDGSLLSLRRR